MYRSIIVFLIIAIGIGFLFFSPKSTPPPEPVAKNLIATVTYLCDENKTISASYYETPTNEAPSPEGPPVPTGSVDLILGDMASVTLKQTISGSGVRYANADESFVFWNKGEDAMVMRDGEMDPVYSHCIDSNSKYAGWTATTTDMMSFRYPDFSYQYISAVSWPPKIERSESPYTCLTGEEKQIDGTTYCVTTSSEGAAGSTFTTYVYEREGLRAEVTLRFPQCLNYDNPEQTSCLQEQERLDIDALITSIFATVS